MMVNLKSILVLLSTAQLALTTPLGARSAYSVKETHAVPSRWTCLGRAPADHNLHLKIGLNQDRFEELERHLYEVSDPDHHRYGKHLSDDEVNEYVKPSDETLDLVHEWLFANGVDKFNYSPAKDWVNIYIPVEQAERLLDTEYSVYQHEDGSTLVRTETWSLPLHLHDLVDTVQPTNSFLRSEPQATDFQQIDAAVELPEYTAPSNATIQKVCNVSIVTLDCFKTLYSFLNYKQKVPGKNSIGFNNYLNQTPIRPDIHDFLKLYNPVAAPYAYKFKSVSINGGVEAQNTSLTFAQTNGSDISEEAVLDAETILGLTYPMNVTSFSTGGSPPFIPDLVTPTDTNEPYLAWVTYVLAQKKLPHVISSSYGDDEQSVPKSFAKRVCKSFAQLGARGITLVCSSGDSGLGDQDGSTCLSNDGKNTTTFLPAFPASCPYVTTVGATQQFEPEVAAHRTPGLGFDGKTHGFYASGSGFSNYFPRPAYQNTVVPAYLKALPAGLYKGMYNKSGRAYPDVSAQGLYFAFYWNGTLGTISGTSASCPLSASVFALVNDARIAAGKGPLGFLNPWLYKKGYKGFTDITAGNSSSCGTNGFPVTKGWDPVTGFGTPIFPKLVQMSGV